MIGEGAYEPLSRENGHKIARWFTPKSKSLKTLSKILISFIMGIWVLITWRYKLNGPKFVSR